jgi:hypothetical protein
MQDQPTTWRDVIGALIIGLAFAILTAAFI